MGPPRMGQRSTTAELERTTSRSSSFPSSCSSAGISSLSFSRNASTCASEGLSDSRAIATSAVNALSSFSRNPLSCLPFEEEEEEELKDDKGERLNGNCFQSKLASRRTASEEASSLATVASQREMISSTSLRSSGL